MFRTLKGIHSCRVDGNLIGGCVPKKRKQLEQNVRSGNKSQSTFRESWKNNRLDRCYGGHGIEPLCTLSKTVKKAKMAFRKGEEIMSFLF